MSVQFRPSKIRYGTFSILIAICLTIAVAVLWSTQPLLTTSLSASWPTSASNVNRSLWLRLDLSVNSTSLGFGDGIRIRMSEHNELPTVNSVETANKWMFQYLSLGPCDGAPIGFAILRGYHSANDLTATDVLSLYPSVFIACPADYVVSSYDFAAHSSNATWKIFGYGSSSSMSAVRDFRGTWTGTSSTDLHPFSPGGYTLVGGDEWGDLLTLRFTVS